MVSLELLAPAKNLECGIAAIDHGADAVYIGAPRFGARAAAGNSVDDIGALCRYAHQFDAKVYVTTNTIIFDDELDDTFRLIEELKTAGVDAILVQDMAIKASPTGGGWRGLDVHASTQTDNRTPEKVAWLRAQGFSRVVLARELSLEEIREIHRSVPDVELEAFVHGALCVSYSGQCYLSEYCQGRSANRGECAQMCRMKYDLVDADGREIEHQRHLLSLKDLCRIDDLEALADAGVVSFKIEGRLKDVAYVKNVVSAYSQRLDALCRQRCEDYRRASRGRVTHFFTPDLRKTFNRGYTKYFLHGRERDIWSPDTPKALGEHVGRVKSVDGRSLTVAGTATFSNGDGLCFFKASPPNPLSKGRGGVKGLEGGVKGKELVGFRVNRVEQNRLFPLKMPEGLSPGMDLYRNNDAAFERLLSGKTAERKIPVRMVFRTVEEGFELVVRSSGVQEFRSSEERWSREVLTMEKTLAETPQRENIVRQLTKLGNTPFVCEEITIEGDADRYFIPSSQLAELRRRISLSPALSERRESHEEAILSNGEIVKSSYPQTDYTRRFPHTLNVKNHLAREFYAQQGIDADPNAPLQLLMQCRHCLRYSLGHCTKHGGEPPTWREPLSLRLADGRRFRVAFDCQNCQMNILSERIEELKN